MESLVYIELRRRGRSTSYVITSGGHEVDFLAEARSGGRELVQVCAETTSTETRQRELRALDEAMQELGIETATMVTLRDEDAVEVGGRWVQIVPAWRWLLDR